MKGNINNNKISLLPTARLCFIIMAINTHTELLLSFKLKKMMHICPFLSFSGVFVLTCLYKKNDDAGLVSAFHGSCFHLLLWEWSSSSSLAASWMHLPSSLTPTLPVILPFPVKLYRYKWQHTNRTSVGKSHCCSKRHDEKTSAVCRWASARSHFTLVYYKSGRKSVLCLNTEVWHLFM